MADPLGRLCTGYRKNDEPIREPIARLGKMISDRMEVMLGKEKLQKSHLSTGALHLYVLTNRLLLP